MSLHWYMYNRMTPVRPVKPVTVMAYVSQLGRWPLRKESGMFIWIDERERERTRKKRKEGEREEGALKMAILWVYSNAAI